MKTEMKNVRLYVMAILMLLPGLGMNLQAQRGQRMGAPGRMAFRDSMPGHLQLTEEQQKQILDIRVAHQKVNLDIQNQLNEQRAHLKTLIDKDDFNQKEVDKTIEEIGKLQVSLMKNQVRHQQELKKILPEGMLPLIHQRHRMERGIRPGLRHDRERSRFDRERD